MRPPMPVRCGAGIAASRLHWDCSDRSTNNPVGQQKSTRWLTNRPVTYSGSPLPSIRKITLCGKWPTPLGNGLLGEATGRPAGERSEPENAPLRPRWQTYMGASRGLPGCPRGCCPWAKFAGNSPALVGKQICRVLATQLTTYLFWILYARF